MEARLLELAERDLDKHIWLQEKIRKDYARMERKKAIAKWVFLCCLVALGMLVQKWWGIL